MFRSVLAAAAIALAVTPLGAAAQTAPAPAPAAATVTGYAVQTPPAPVNDARDPLATAFTQPLFLQRCASQPVTGPLATPEAGSAAAQPLYQWLQDFNRVGSCRKDIF